VETGIGLKVGPREATVGGNLTTVSPVTVTIPATSRAVTNTLVVTLSIGNTSDTNGSVTPREGVAVNASVTATMRASDIDTVVHVATAVTVVLDTLTAAFTIGLANTKSVLEQTSTIVEAFLEHGINTISREETILIGIDALTPRMEVRTTVNPAITESQKTLRLVGREENLVVLTGLPFGTEIIATCKHVTIRGTLNTESTAVDGSLTTVVGNTVTVNPSWSTVVETMSGPAELIGGVLHNVLERAVGSESGGPVTTITDSLGGERRTVNVLVAGLITAIITLAEIKAVELSARVGVATPILLVELTSPGLNVTRVQTANFLTVGVVLVELITEAKEATDVFEGSLKNLTGTDTNTTSIVTITSSRALRPRRPLGEDTRILRVGSRIGSSASPGRSASKTEIANLIIRTKGIRIARSNTVSVGLDGEVTNKSTIKVSPVSLNSARAIHDRKEGVARDSNTDLETVTNPNIIRSVLEPVLDKRQVAITTVSSLNEDLTSADTSLQPVIEIRDTVISNGAITPVGPLRENTVNGVLVNE